MLCPPLSLPRRNSTKRPPERRPTFGRTTEKNSVTPPAPPPPRLPPRPGVGGLKIGAACQQLLPFLSLSAGRVAGGEWCQRGGRGWGRGGGRLDGRGTGR